MTGMEKSDSIKSLDNSIQLLEQTKAMEWVMLKTQLEVIKESARPASIVKAIWKEVTTSPDRKEKLSSTAMGLAAGYLTKKIVVAGSHNPVLKIAGLLIQSGVSVLIAKNPEFVESITHKVMNFLNRKKRVVREDQV